MSNYQIIKQGYGQYQLLDGGYDAFGELVSLKECKAYIINRQQRERTFNNAKLVKVMAKWADCSADVAQGLLGDVVTYAYTDDLRKMNKRPSYLIEYLNAREHAKDQYRANSARIEAEQSTLDYYEGQLDKLQGAVSDQYGINVKFTSSKCGDTNFMALNDDSASAIVEFLSNNYTLTLK